MNNMCVTIHIITSLDNIINLLTFQQDKCIINLLKNQQGVFMDRYKEFTMLFNKISKYIRRIKDIEMSKFNLKSSHMTCLYFLYKEGKMTSKELCDACEEDKSIISKSLKFLEKRDFVECLDDVKKRYNSSFVLTKKGINVGVEIVNKVDEILGHACDGINFENLTVFYKGLLKINYNLEKTYKEKYVNELGGEDNE